MKQFSFEEQYLAALDNVLHCGIDTTDRTGTGRRRLPNVHFSINLFETDDYDSDPKFVLPVLNGKKVFPLMGCKEMTWMLSGDTNIKALEDNKVTYWREWADENGDLGPVYGKQFRDMNGADQLKYVANKLFKDPMSTQILINLWNAGDLNRMALPPCHFSYYFQALPCEDVKCANRNGMMLNLHLVQRSADSFLGVPYNAIMASYFLQLMCIAFNFEPGYLYWTCHDFHIYHNHFDAVQQYMQNVREDKYLTCGDFTELVLDKKSYDILTKPVYDGDNAVLKIDEFIKYCFDSKFSNMKAKRPGETYDVISADIAV